MTLPPVPVRARLAPTPSGFLHRGNAANFALNALLAEGGELLLRIDDLDRGRFRPAYLSDVFRLIEWLGLTVTEGPRDAEDFARSWSLEHRLPLYAVALAQLRHHPRVFACPCTRRELAGGHHVHGCLSGKVDLDDASAAWRINTRSLPPVEIPDRVRKSPFTVSYHEVIPDFVIRQKNHRPSYQLACTVDDQLFRVTRVGRGQDLLPSTAAQALLSDLLGYPALFDRISFVHHPLLTDTLGDKLSKSAGAQAVSDIGSGLQPEEVFALARGWLRP